MMGANWIGMELGVMMTVNASLNDQQVGQRHLEEKRAAGESVAA